MRINQLKQFFALESASGCLIMAMAVLAILWANSPLSFLHKALIHFSSFSTNECLMVFFFLLIGLELKREYKDGELSHPARIALPAFAALGGMLIPALIYIFFNYSDPSTLKGWATPLATDTAFSLAVLSFFGQRIPPALRVFLLALAIFDDLGAIFIITFFYSHGLKVAPLIASCITMGILWVLNQLVIKSLLLYLLMGVVLWFFFLKGGIHPTLVGVLLALFIPDTEPKTTSPLRVLEKRLHPWVAYCILPLFALVNAGFDMRHLSFNFLLNKIVLGIVAGLFIGKQVGIFIFSYVAVRCKIAKKMRHTSWLMIYSVGILCGIGFTMSLFIGTLSFAPDEEKLAAVRAGVFLGSILSGAIGALVLAQALKWQALKLKKVNKSL